MTSSKRNRRMHVPLVWELPRFGPRRSVGHAWIEFKINQQDWWPLDPQIEGKILPSRGYFPIMVNPFYEVADQEEFTKIYNDRYYGEEPPFLKKAHSFTKIRQTNGAWLDFMLKAGLVKN